MQRLAFDYRMELRFSAPCASSRFTLRCLPPSSGAQRVLDQRLTLAPETPVAEAVDAFGNRYVYGSVNRAHDAFACALTGTAEAGRQDAVDAVSEPQRILYRQASPLASISSALRSFALGLHTTEPVAVMHAVYGALAYAKGSTTVHTTADEAFRQGRGVCQDYAHVMIAVCRALAMPARYVAGMMVGEGESHAWCEVAVGGRWLAFDPTNDLAVADAHLKLAHGRDAADCPINRGIIRGNGSQEQSVRVLVAPQ